MKLISFSQFFFGSSSFRSKAAAVGCNERRRWRRGWSSVPAAASCLWCWWILRHSSMSGEGAGECMDEEDEPTTPTDGAPTTSKIYMYISQNLQHKLKYIYSLSHTHLHAPPHTHTHLYITGLAEKRKIPPKTSTSSRTLARSTLVSCTRKSKS